MAYKKNETDSGLSQLKADLKNKTLDRLYFFSGEETFLLHHYLTQMKKQLIDPLTESFNYHRFTSETFDLRDFGDAVENLPMMAEHTFVRVDDVDLFKMNEGEREHMIGVLSDIPDYCTLVFTFETVPWKPDKRLKKLWEAVSKGQIVEFCKQNQRDLIAWIGRHFASRGKQISPELAAYLIDLTGGTMTALSGEIEKISAFSGADAICRADIDAVVEPVLDAVVFEMTDLMSAGKYDQALLKLQQLFKMQQEPLAILGAVGAHFRRLGTARTLLDSGKNSQELQKLCGMADYPARKTMEAARRFKPSFFKTAMEQILETDYKIKTSFDEGKRLLEMLILCLSQEARK